MPEIARLGAGIELGSYGMVGVRSEQSWEARFALHQAICAEFQGTVAIHGPFLGMEYGHTDHLIRDAVGRRLDMTFDVATRLKVSRVILHSGYRPEIDLFKLQDSWLKTCVDFWQREIRRWADARIQIVLENDTEKSPDVLVRLVDEVDNPFLGLCLDIGHLHVFSELDAVEWLRRTAHRLFYIHLHDNDGTDDSPWSIERETIHFESFYDAMLPHLPRVTISLEVVDEMEVKMGDLRKLAVQIASKRHASGVS